MTVSIPVTLTTIETAWGAQVAADVNGLLARTTALEGINAGTRLGTAESEIDALQAATLARGTRGTVDVTGLPASWNAVRAITWDVVAGAALSADTTYTVPVDGVYGLIAQVSYASGTGVIAYWSVNGSPIYSQTLLAAGFVGGSPVMALDAGATVSYVVGFAGTAGTISSGFMHINKVGEAV